MEKSNDSLKYYEITCFLNCKTAKVKKKKGDRDRGRSCRPHGSARRAARRL